MFRGNTNRRLMPQEKKRLKRELELEKFTLETLGINKNKPDLCRVNEKLKILSKNMRKSNFTYDDFIKKSHSKSCKFR